VRRPKSFGPLGRCKDGVIYFIGFGDYVKIGFTRQLQKRLENIQTGCPEPLVVYASIPGSMKLEYELHQRFALFRLHREWFRKTPELTSFIAECVTPNERAA
jgi:hypothetical protein